jgi:nucleotide-binding universal stress UspA family protein
VAAGQLSRFDCLQGGHDATSCGVYRTILVGLDGSEREAEVFRTAVDLARAIGAVLHVCRAVAMPVGLPEAVWSMPMAQLDKELVADAERAVAARVATSPVPVLRAHVRIGVAPDVLHDVAVEIGADLVVIGAHGYGMIERLIGTTASKVVHRMPCATLVCRGERRPESA